MSYTDTLSALPRKASIGALSHVRVCRIEGVPPLTVSLGGIYFELNRCRPVQILSMCFSDQVGRVDTNRVRVGTRVADLQTDRDGSKGQPIAHPMSEFRSSAAATKAELPVPTRYKATALPQPTFSSLVHLRPETGLQWANDLLRTLVHKRVAMALKPSVVHPAPPTLFRHLQTIRSGAIHV